MVQKEKKREEKEKEKNRRRINLSDLSVNRQDPSQWNGWRFSTAPRTPFECQNHFLPITRWQPRGRQLTDCAFNAMNAIVVVTFSPFLPPFSSCTRFLERQFRSSKSDHNISREPKDKLLRGTVDPFCRERERGRGTLTFPLRPIQGKMGRGAQN